MGCRRALTIGTCVLTVGMCLCARSASPDGLVHVSQLADDFVKDIASVVKVGDDVQVRITEINLETNKVSLSMRSENAKPQKSQGAGGEGKKQGGGGPAGMLGGAEQLIIELAKGNGMIHDATLRQDLMRLHSLNEIARYTNLRMKAAKAAGQRRPLALELSFPGEQQPAAA